MSNLKKKSAAFVMVKLPINELTKEKTIKANPEN